jgi:hypothetical protein
MRANRRAVCLGPTNLGKHRLGFRVRHAEDLRVALWNYLSLLAKVSPLASSETEVGLYLLKEQVKTLQKDRYHEVAPVEFEIASDLKS